MYKIEKNNMGFKLTFAGSLSKEEIELFTQESEKALKTCKGELELWLT